MESKLAILKDAWNEFLLDKTISNAAKGVVDLATSFLNLINKLNDLPGALGTASKALVAFGVFKGGKKIFDGLSAGISQGKEAARVGESFSESFFQGFKSGLKTKKITTNDFDFSTILTEETKKSFEKMQKSTIKFDNLSIDSDDLESALNDALEGEEELLSNLTASRILDNEQAQAAIDLTRQGLSLDDAVRVAKEGITDVEALQSLAMKGVTDATQKQIAAEKIEIALSKQKEKATLSEVAALKTKTAAEKMNSAAEKVSNWSEGVQEKGGLAQAFSGKLKDIFSGQFKQVGEVGQSLKSMVSSTIGIIKSIGTAIGPVGIAVAGVTAAVVAGIIVWKKYFSFEAKMANAQKAVEDASVAAQEAKTRYDDLLSAKDNYTGLQDTLENLVKGTEEWNKALIDSNNQVLELLNTYPILAKYLSNDNGVLKIGSEGWDKVIEQAQNLVTSTAVGQMQAQSTVKSLEKDKLEDEGPSNKGTGGTLATALKVRIEKGLLNAEDLIDFDKVKSFLASQEGFIDTSGELIYTDEQIQTAISSLREFNSELADINTEMSSYRDSIAQTLAEGAKVPKEFAANFAEQMQNEDAIKDEAERLTHGTRENSGAAGELKKLGIDSTGNQEKDLVRLYQELTGETQEEALTKFAKDGDISKVNDTKIAKAIAKFTITDITIKKVEEGYKKLNQVYNKSSDDFKKFTGLMSDNGKELTSALAETYSDANATKEFLKQTADKMGLNKKAFAELYGFDSFDEMAEKFTERAKTSNELLVNSAQEINSILSGQDNKVFTESNDNYKSLTETMNLGDQTAFNQRLVAIATEMGQTGVDNFLKVFSTVFEDESLVDSEKTALLNALPTIDLEDIQTYKDFENVLDDLGIDIENLSEENLSDLKESIGALAATSKRTIIDLTQAKNKLESLKSSKSLVESAMDDNTTSFSEEDWQTLKSAGISMDDFFFTGETYNYLGNMSDLLQKIKDDTNSIRQKMLAQTTKDVEEGAKIADFVNQTGKYSLSSDKNGEKIITNESLLDALFNNQDIYKGDVKLSEDEKAGLARSILQQIIGSEEFQNLGGDAMSGPLATKFLENIYTNKYGVGGTIYQNNKSQYGSNIQEIQNPLDAQKGATELQNQIAQAQAAQTETLKQEAETSDEAAAKLEKWKALEESATKALQNKWTVLKGSQKELDNYIKKQKKVDEVTDDLREQYKAEYLDLKELQGNIKTTREKTEDLFETLESDPGNNNALSQLADAAQRYLGLNLSQEWLEQGDNLEKFKKGISGTEKEFNQFLSEFAEGDKQDFNIAIGLDLDSDEVVKKFQDAGINIEREKEQLQTWLEEHPIKVDATTGEIDFTAIFNHLVSMGYSAQEVLKALQSLANVSISFDTEWDYYDIGQLPKGTEGAELVSIGGSGKWRVPKKVTGKYTGPGSIDVKDYNDKDTGSSGGSSGSDKEYESDYDKYYNLLKKIERVQENRNKLQDEYSKMLDDEDESYGAIANKQSSILSNLKNEVDYQKQLAAGRLSQISQLQEENSDLTGYASYDQNLNKVQINYDAIKSVKDSDLGEKIDDYISDLETWADSYTDSQQTILELQQDIDDLIKAGTIDLDKSTNVLEQIEEIQNSITNIEAEREILLGNLNFSQEALSKSYEDQLTLLKQQVSAQAMLLDEREKQYQDSIKKTVGGNWTKFFVEVSKGRFEVNWDILSKENQTVIDEALERLEQVNEAGEAIQEATEQVNDAKKALQDFNQELKDKEISFFNQVKDALVENYQQQIDKLTAINDSINKSNTNILSAISESIEKQRQERENEKTEQNLSDMQNQLAFLKMDTSGANQVQILELQKSIDEQTEDYTDTLIDQRISELEDQNSKAFEQRQTQIDLMQQHLEYIQKTGEINQQVQDIINKGVGLDGRIVPGSDLETILKGTAEYIESSDTEKAQLWKDIQEAATAYIKSVDNTPVGGDNSTLAIGTVLSDLEGTIKKLNESLPKEGKFEAVVSDVGKVTMTNEKGQKFEISGVDEDANGNPVYRNAHDTTYKAGDARILARAAGRLELTDEERERLKTIKANLGLDEDAQIKMGDARMYLRRAARLDEAWVALDAILAQEAVDDPRLYVNNYDTDKDKEITTADVNKIYENLGKKKKFDSQGYPVFKTGGLANFTGPAWLDGTASKPELVLNQRDTENFIQLKDILSSVLRNVNGQTATKTGDTYYEIHIEVDKLDSDYSVDDVANRVKQIIATDANYRNVNLINNLR